MAENPTDLLLRWDSPEAFPASLKQILAPDQLIQADPSPAIVGGLWPGIRRPANRRAREEEVASASTEPWVDANGYLIAFHRALNPSRSALLAYRADAKAGVRPDVEIPFGTVELALVEARVMGGNIVLDLPPRFRDTLLKNDPKALEAWGNLARTAAWLKSNANLFGRPAFPAITALVEPSMACAEIANLLHRRGASPLLWSAGAPVPANLAAHAIVAAALKQIPQQCFGLVEAGQTLVIDQAPPTAAKLVRQESDRAFYALGKGTIVAYNRRIVDPSEFALDVIDIITHKRRATRLWNSTSSIPLATQGERPGQAVLHVINYGSGAREEVQAHVQGHFAKATLLRPEAPALELKTAKRGTSTEVFLPTLQRVATVRFSN
jgi:hypothetical protein